MEEEAVRRTMAEIGLSASPATAADIVGGRSGWASLADAAMRPSCRTPVTDPRPRWCLSAAVSLLYAGGCLVGSAPSPFRPHPSPLGWWAMRAYGDLADAEPSVSAKQSSRDHVSASAATGSSETSPFSDLPTESYLHSAMELEAILSFLDQMFALVHTLMGDEVLSLGAAKLDAYEAACKLPTGASRPELLTQRAEQIAKGAAVMLLRASLVCGLLPSAHAVDRRVVGLKVADQLEGDCLEAAMGHLQAVAPAALVFRDTRTTPAGAFPFPPLVPDRPLRTAAALGRSSAAGKISMGVLPAPAPGATTGAPVGRRSSSPPSSLSLPSPPSGCSIPRRGADAGTGGGALLRPAAGADAPTGAAVATPHVAGGRDEGGGDGGCSDGRGCGCNSCGSVGGDSTDCVGDGASCDFPLLATPRLPRKQSGLPPPAQSPPTPHPLSLPLRAPSLLAASATAVQSDGAVQQVGQAPTAVGPAGGAPAEAAAAATATSVATASNAKGDGSAGAGSPPPPVSGAFAAASGWGATACDERPGYRGGGGGGGGGRVRWAPLPEGPFTAALDCGGRCGPAAAAAPRDVTAATVVAPTGGAPAPDPTGRLTRGVPPAPPRRASQR